MQDTVLMIIQIIIAPLVGFFFFRINKMSEQLTTFVTKEEMREHVRMSLDVINSKLDYISDNLRDMKRDLHEKN